MLHLAPCRVMVFGIHALRGGTARIGRWLMWEEDRHAGGTQGWALRGIAQKLPPEVLQRLKTNPYNHRCSEIGTSVSPSSCAARAHSIWRLRTLASLFTGSSLALPPRDVLDACGDLRA